MNKKVYYEKPNSYTQNKRYQKTVRFSGPGKKSDSNKGVKELVFNAILIVLSIGFVFSLFNVISEARYCQMEFTQEEDTFWYYIKEGDYPRIVLDMYHNNNVDFELTPGLEQCYAVARYFEAASLYKVAVQTKNQEDMEKYSAVMKENLTYMDDILYIAEDINKELGIE